MSLLTLPISCFVGLIRWHLVSLLKFSLWSFMGMNAGFGIVHDRLFSILCYLHSFWHSVAIVLQMLSSIFL